MPNPSMLVLFALLLVPLSSWADLIKFNNGDQLQGKIISMQDGVIKLDSPVVGEVSIALDKIASFSTEQAAELHFQDGTVLQQPVELSGQGSIQLSESMVASSKTISLTQLAGINPPKAEPVEWKGRAAGGLVIDTGNSETQNVQAQVNAKRESEQDRIILNLEFIEKRETDLVSGNKNTSKRRYEMGVHYDYFNTPKFFTYGDVNAEKEVTANLDLRLTMGLGGGYRWINTDTTDVDFQAGLSWVNESFAGGSEDTDYVAARFGWRYYHDINPAVHFFHDGEWFPSLENAEDQLVKTETGIRSKINGHLFVEAKVVFDWDQTPADGAKKEDTSYIFSAGWDF